MKKQVGRRILVLGAAAAGLATTSCASATEEESSTPRVTVDGNSDLGSYLLTADDVRSVDGLGDSTVTDFNDVPSFENPDPRGPCGGVVPEPDFSGAAGRAFVGPASTALTLVLESGDALQNYLRALQADVTEPCASFQSTTNTGATQTVSEITVLDFEGDSSEAVGWTSRVQIGPQSGYAGVWLIEADGRAVFIQYQGLEPVSASAMEVLAERAYRRLAG